MDLYQPGNVCCGRAGAQLFAGGVAAMVAHAAIAGKAAKRSRPEALDQCALSILSSQFMVTSGKLAIVFLAAIPLGADTVTDFVPAARRLRRVSTDA